MLYAHSPFGGIVDYQSNINYIQLSEIQGKTSTPFAQYVVNKFNIIGKKINPTDFLKVSVENEGSHLKFETLDKIVITVPVEFASGVGNKDIPIER